MDSLFNQYSAIIVAATLVLLVALVMFTGRKPTWREYAALGVLVAGLVAAWIVLHPRQTPLMEDAKMVQEMIGDGKPVLLEFQSPYCIGCTRLKPVVDELEAEYGQRVLFIRLNIQESVGRELAPVYGFEFTPTFIFFDAQGNELWRSVGELDIEQFRRSVPQ
ncbi:MAG: thioredoxin family protein [Chloroflexota bacterium]